MDWLQLISLYFLIGVINAFIIDLWHSVLVKIASNEFENYNNWERIVLILLWPIYASVFWYIFWKNFFRRNNDN